MAELSFWGLKHLAKEICVDIPASQQQPMKPDEPVMSRMFYGSSRRLSNIGSQTEPKHAFAHEKPLQSTSNMIGLIKPDTPQRGSIPIRPTQRSPAAASFNLESDDELIIDGTIAAASL